MINNLQAANSRKALFKRVFDILVSGLCSVLFIPLFLIIALIIKLKLGGPVLFCQVRPGLNGIPFKLIKFRTMCDAVDSKGIVLPDAERLTSFGKFLRSTSLDELPELLNVLKGEMSLVGPRPLLLEYMALYDSKQQTRHNVKPGITGWAQVNGRNGISWDERFKLDLFYVNHYSFIMDLKILFITIKKVIFREGISASGHVTVEKFSGNSGSES